MTPKVVTNQLIKMSLDVYLTSAEEKEVVCSYCDQPHMENEELYWGNITHNLGDMAEKAGIYKALWRPEELKANRAEQIIPLLKMGLRELLNNPEEFKKLDSKNGWGTYEPFVGFVTKYLEACEANPTAIINVSR